MLSQACARAETCYICEQKSNGPPKDADGEEKVRGIRESRSTNKTPILDNGIGH